MSVARQIDENRWAVDSFTGNGAYFVFPSEERCTCPHHVRRGAFCKHLQLIQEIVHPPQVDLSTHTCTCKEFTDRRDGKRIGVLFVTCAHLQAARKAASEPPANAYTRAAERARVLDDAALWQSLERYPAGPVAGAIRMELARRANEQPEPKPLPTGVMELLAGATPAEVERALAVYGR